MTTIFIKEWLNKIPKERRKEFIKSIWPQLLKIKTSISEVERLIDLELENRRN